MNTKTERIIAFIALGIIALALTNVWVIKDYLFGISAKILAVIAFWIGGLVMFWLLRHRIARAQK